MPSCYWCNDSFGHRPDCPVLEVNALRARVAELEAGISTAMQLIEGGFDSAAYEALEALNAHK